MASAFEKWITVNNLLHPDHGFLRCGDQYLDGNLVKRVEAWDAALEEARKEQAGLRSLVGELADELSGLVAIYRTARAAQGFDAGTMPSVIRAEALLARAEKARKPE